MAHCCTAGNLGDTKVSGPPAATGPFQSPPASVPRRASSQGPQSPTQLSPEGLSHRPPLGLITLTLLVNGLHNQVHDVEQDPGNKRQLIRGQDGGSREHPWFPHIPPDMRKACTQRLAGAGVDVGLWGL